MHYLFAIPLIGGVLLLLALTLAPRLSRISFNLWNSGVATLTTGFLLRGIINLSGRSTTLDQPYWYIGGSLLLLAILTCFLPTSHTRQKSHSNVTQDTRA